jgi:hypothetical protein
MSAEVIVAWPGTGAGETSFAELTFDLKPGMSQPASASAAAKTEMNDTECEARFAMAAIEPGPRGTGQVLGAAWLRGRDEAMDMHTFLEPKIDLPRVAELLDGLGHEGRVHSTSTWSAHHKSAIFEAAKGFRPIDLEFLVPGSVGRCEEVVHEGYNSMALFSRLEKRFANIASAGAPEIVGFNEQTWRAFTGPGYFSVSLGEAEHEGELVIDYRKIPREKPASWPALRPNTGILGSVVFGGMIDYLRGISQHVSIGAATKDGVSRKVWFALVRQDRG